jgi:Sigma-70 region 2
MDERDWLADRFQAHRPRLRAVAYRMLGSLSEADDAVQEAWLHVSRADTASVTNFGGWLTTLVARVCLDLLRSRTARREEPLGVHVPDPRARIVQPALVNGAAGVVVAPAGHLSAIIGITVRRGKIVEIDILADPARLRQLGSVKSLCSLRLSHGPRLDTGRSHRQPCRHATSQEPGHTCRRRLRIAETLPYSTSCSRTHQ